MGTGTVVVIVAICLVAVGCLVYAFIRRSDGNAAQATIVSLTRVNGQQAIALSSLQAQLTDAVAAGKAQVAAFEDERSRTAGQIADLGRRLSDANAALAKSGSPAAVGSAALDVLAGEAGPSGPAVVPASAGVPPVRLVPPAEG